jgi:precorrin-2 dehydrogenase/sirohydrochlorin ferrochelatase
VGGLLAAGAIIVAVSPQFSPAFLRLRPSAAVTRVQRRYRSGDLAGMSLAVAATDDPAVNAEVRAEARQSGVWVSVVDDPRGSDFIVPAVVRRGPFLLAMSTGGASPGLAGRLRRELDRLVPEDVGSMVGLLAEIRGRIRARVNDPARRRAIMARLLTLDLLATLRRGGSDAVLR